METYPIFETVLFTKLTTEKIDKAKPSQVIPLLKLEAKKWGLDISRQKNWDVALKIIKNSIKNN